MDLIRYSKVAPYELEPPEPSDPDFKNKFFAFINEKRKHIDSIAQHMHFGTQVFVHTIAPQIFDTNIDSTLTKIHKIIDILVIIRNKYIITTDSMIAQIRFDNINYTNYSSITEDFIQTTQNAELMIDQLGSEFEDIVVSVIVPPPQ